MGNMYDLASPQMANMDTCWQSWTWDRGNPEGTARYPTPMEVSHGLYIPLHPPKFQHLKIVRSDYFQLAGILVLKDQSHKSHKAPISHSTAVRICTFLFWIVCWSLYVMGYGTDALWEMWDWSIVAQKCLRGSDYRPDGGYVWAIMGFQTREYRLVIKLWERAEGRVTEGERES